MSTIATRVDDARRRFDVDPADVFNYELETGRSPCGAQIDAGVLDTRVQSMTYVDLNPVRAGIAQDLPESAYTSVRARLEAPADDQELPIAAVAGPPVRGFVPLSARQYIELVDWSGRQLHPSKKGHIAPDAAPPIPKDIDTARWLAQVRGVESRYCRAIGSAQALLDKAREMGQRWLMVRRVERCAR